LLNTLQPIGIRQNGALAIGLQASGTRYLYQGDVGWDKLDSLYKELMREEKLNKLGI
jgi:hypothetical protein